MTLLMEAGLVDGEEAATVQSDYVQASCLVTSSTDRMSFATGESISRCFRLEESSAEEEHIFLARFVFDLVGSPSKHMIFVV